MLDDERVRLEPRIAREIVERHGGPGIEQVPARRANGEGGLPDTAAPPATSGAKEQSLATGQELGYRAVLDAEGRRDTLGDGLHHRLHVQGLQRKPAESGERRLLAVERDQGLPRFDHLADVVHRYQTYGLTFEGHVVGGDVHPDDATLFRPVPPVPGPEQAASRRRRAVELDVLLRPNIQGGHREEFLSAVAVVRDGRLVDVQEAMRLGIEDPGRSRIALEETAVALLGVAKTVLGAAPRLTFLSLPFGAHERGYQPAGCRLAHHVGGPGLEDLHDLIVAERARVEDER